MEETTYSRLQAISNWRNMVQYTVHTTITLSSEYEMTIRKSSCPTYGIVNWLKSLQAFRHEQIGKMLQRERYINGKQNAFKFGEKE